MKRNILIIGILVLVCSFSLAFITGCAKSPGVMMAEQEAVSAEGASSMEADAAAAKEAAAMREKTLRENLLAEAASLGDVYFDYDRYDLSAESRGVLSKLADWLIEHGDFEMTVEGHCDERGTTEYNLALGERRAEAAKAYLKNLGVDAVRITTISYGEELPVDPGSTEDAWSKNRRDHFVIFLKNQ